MRRGSLGRAMRGVMAVAMTLATLATLVAPIGSVVACSCVGQTRVEAIAGADIAFTGTAIAREPMRELDPDSPEETAIAVYTFEIGDPIKGELGDEVKIRAGGHEASCGLSFGLGEQWFVVAQANGAGFVTGLCSGSQQTDEAPIEVGREELAPPRTPDLVAADVDGPPLGLIGAGIAVLALVAVSVAAFRGGQPR